MDADFNCCAQALKPFGATWTDRPPDATHLVVKGISRTEKFLCCASLPLLRSLDEVP